jgi:hypothetical protein
VGDEHVIGRVLPKYEVIGSRNGFERSGLNDSKLGGLRNSQRNVCDRGRVVGLRREEQALRSLAVRQPSGPRWLVHSFWKFGVLRVPRLRIVLLTGCICSLVSAKQRVDLVRSKTPGYVSPLL